MSFNFRTLDFGFWRDMKLEKVPFHLSSFFVWLFTNEHSHYSGLYYIPIETMAYDTGLSIEDIEKRLAELAVKPYVVYDKDTCFIWVVNMAKRQVKASNAVNMIKGINKQLETIKSPMLVRQFIEKYSGLEATQKSTSEVFGIKAPDDMEHVIDVVPMKPLSAPPIARKKPKPLPKPKNDPLIQERFDKFWDIWPRRDAKEAAWKTWQKLNPDDKLTEKILFGVKNAIRALDWASKAASKEDRQYVPLPATWLNAQRWEDELESEGTGQIVKECTKDNPAPKGAVGWRHPTNTVVEFGGVKVWTCSFCGASGPA